MIAPSRRMPFADPVPDTIPDAVPDTIPDMATNPPPPLPPHSGGDASPGAILQQHSGLPEHGPIEAFSSMLRSILVALFVLTFILQPMVIPSESMERTLLVGDFLIVNRIVLAPAGNWRWLLAYHAPKRGEIVTFHSPLNPADYLVKRVIGLPGDRLRMENGRVWINGQELTEPYVVFEPGETSALIDRFPASLYTDPRVDAAWWRQMQSLTHNGEMLIPAGKYFMLGDNRNHSLDSRYWGFVDRSAIVARPVFLYFSLNQPSRTDLVAQVAGSADGATGTASRGAPDDRLGHDDDLWSRVEDFARWKRFFRVIR